MVHEYFCLGAGKMGKACRAERNELQLEAHTHNVVFHSFVPWKMLLQLPRRFLPTPSTD